MKLKELLASTEVQLCRADPDIEIGGLKLDSRLVTSGDIFFALPGEKLDGAQFIQQAVASGAVLVVTERDVDTTAPLLVVANVHKALAEMAAAYYRYPARAMRMIGVTGTNGKTTVSHIIKGILEHALATKVGLIGTNANQIGDKYLDAQRTTPDALSLHALLRVMVDEGCTHCVMEVSSHALVQKRVWGIQYNVTAFTNLSQDHLDYHNDMEDYFLAKQILFDQCNVAVINIDDPYGRRLLDKSGLDYVTYSAEKDQADVISKNIRYMHNRVEFEAVTRSEIARIEWSTPGAFSVYNALAAVTTMLVEGLSLRAIAAAVRRLPPVKGRMEVLEGPGGVPVIIDYAHTPDALKNLLMAVKSYHSGRVITLFGCGGDRDKTKRPQMAAVAAALSDVLIVTSDNPRSEPPGQIIKDILIGLPDNPPPCIVEENRERAIARAFKEARAGDIVLLCGKGHETYQEIDGQKYPFDERTVVKTLVATTENRFAAHMGMEG